MNRLCAELTNPTRARVTEALRRPRRLCHADPDEPCRNIAAGGGPLPDRIVHFVRLTP